MVCSVRSYLLASMVLLGSLAVLAGCSGRFFAEREPWRRGAEVDCLTSGAVSEDAGKVRIEPISGPGACGADFPLKVSLLGAGTPLAFGDEQRPPQNIPVMPPRWPPPPPPYERVPSYPATEP